MNKIILPLMAVLAFIGCGRKESASSSLPDDRHASANSQIDASNVAGNRNVGGKWTGSWETKAPKEVTERMELKLSKDDQQWKGECRFTLYGNDTSNTREVSVEGGRVSFRCDMGSHSEFRFSGQLTGDQIKGTLEIFEHGQKVAAGSWNVTRTKE